MPVRYFSFLALLTGLLLCALGSARLKLAFGKASDGSFFKGW